MKNDRRPLAIACRLLLLAVILIWAIKAERSARIKKRAQRVEQALNSNARIDPASLRMLVDEMKEIGRLNRAGADTGDRTVRLREAFKLLGTNAFSIESEVRREFDSGDNIGDSAWALMDIGDREWPFIINCTESRSQDVKIGALSALGSGEIQSGRHFNSSHVPHQQSAQL